LRIRDHIKEKWWPECCFAVFKLINGGCTYRRLGSQGIRRGSGDITVDK